MQNQDSQYSSVQWPEVFLTGNIEGKSDAALCADALCAWGNCCSGGQPTKLFGEVLVKIGQRLGISPTGENLMKYSDKLLKNSPPKP